MSAEDPTYEERFEKWLLTERREGEDFYRARARFHTINYVESMKAIRRHHGIPEPISPAAPPEPLEDDGADDSVWAKKHPDRRFRVRPWRSEDGTPQVRPGHCITVFDVIRKQGAWGVSIEAMHKVGRPTKIEDTDAYAQLFLITRTESKGFRETLSEAAG